MNWNTHVDKFWFISRKLNRLSFIIIIVIVMIMVIIYY